MDYRHYDFPIAHLQQQADSAPSYRASIGILGWLLIVLVAAAVAAGVVFVTIARNGIMEKSRWSEARANASLMMAALKVELAMNSGDMSVLQDGTMPELAEQLSLDVADFDGKYFAADDYSLCVLDRTDSRRGWCIVVTSSRPDGPPGTYRLYSDGTADEPTDN
ncbi:MAG: hypothetical protein AB7K09_10760 [Planctomycetota bacterium]